MKCPNSALTSHLKDSLIPLTEIALDSWFKTMRLSDQDLHDELFRGLELHAQLDATGAEDPSPMKAASEIMWEDAGSSRFPTNERVRECFGFSKVANNEEETCLLGLYTGLAMIVDDSIMGPAILQEWYEQNKIAEGIINTYGGQDSGYFRWFKEHRHVVDRNYLRPGGPYEVKTGWTIFHSEYMDKYRTGIDGSGDS